MNRKPFLHQASLGLLGFSLADLEGLTQLLPQWREAFSSSATRDTYDVVVVGGSYVGLTAALSLARCLRWVLLIDAGQPRNRSAREAHNLFGMEGAAPARVPQQVREQLAPYRDYLQLQSGRVPAITQENGTMRVNTDAGETFEAQQPVLATGATDRLPDIEGLASLWGAYVHHCPYCHGFESCQGHTLLFSEGFDGLGLLASLRHWCERLSLCVQGQPELPGPLADFLQQQQIDLMSSDLRAVEASREPAGCTATFADGSRQQFAQIYLHPATTYQTDLAVSLGCELDETGRVVTDRFMQSSQPGVYVVGDISNQSMGQIIWAAQSGMMAAVSINNQMIAAAMKN